MKKFIEWFKSSTKMKRWILLILLGIFGICYSIAQIIVMKELEVFEVGKIVLIFIVGFVAVIIGLIYCQKRNIEILIAAGDDRIQNKDKGVKLKSLIFNQNVYDKGPKIVIIGGGNGLNNTVKGLKKFTNNITAVVTMSDYGLEANYSRKQLNLLPTEDIKNSLVALANDDDDMKLLLNHNFKNPALKDINFADIYLTATEEIKGGFSESIELSSKLLNIVGKVIPVSLEEFTICAELKNGEVVEEKEQIAEKATERITGINRVFLKPGNCRVAPGVLEAIAEADAIVMGPGSLYTNVIPNLLVNHVAKGIKDSNAMKIFVSNIMTEPGETDDYSIADHINAIEEHVGGKFIDYCIYDTGEIVPEFIRKYNKLGSDVVEQDLTKIKGIKMIPRDMAKIINGQIGHDTDMISNTIIDLVCDDLKFKDDRNDPKYLLLNARLKEENEKMKIIEAKKEAKKKNLEKNAKRFKQLQEKEEGKDKRKKSKFNEKYENRIKNIQETENQKTKNQKYLKYLEEKDETVKEDFLRNMYKDDKN